MSTEDNGSSNYTPRPQEGMKNAMGMTTYWMITLSILICCIFHYISLGWLFLGLPMLFAGVPLTLGALSNWQ